MTQKTMAVPKETFTLREVELVDHVLARHCSSRAVAVWASARNRAGVEVALRNARPKDQKT